MYIPSGRREADAVRAVSARRADPVRRQSLWAYLVKHKYMYLMLVPAAVYYIVFCYLPMFGVTIAFKKFNPMLGIMKSPWVGLQFFEQLFSLNKFYQVLWNTLSISLTRLVWGFPFPIIIALMLNELRRTRVKKAVQTAIYIPQFISWVVLGGILTNLLSADNGIVNGIIKQLGFEPIRFLTDERYFIPTMVVSMIWKTFGWNTIIYLAALTAVDPQLYEAAIVDGAGRWKQLIHITLPSIMSTIVVVLIMRIGSLMQAGFEQIFVMYHPGVYSVADIIDTYVYRIGLSDGKFELASAVGLFKSLVNFLLIILANRLARSMGEEGVY